MYSLPLNVLSQDLSLCISYFWLHSFRDIFRSFSSLGLILHFGCFQPLLDAFTAVYKKFEVNWHLFLKKLTQPFDTKFFLQKDFHQIHVILVLFAETWNFSIHGKHIFSLNIDLISKGMLIQESKQEVTKGGFLWDVAEKAIRLIHYYKVTFSVIYKNEMWYFCYWTYQIDILPSIQPMWWLVMSTDS